MQQSVAHSTQPEASDAEIRAVSEAMREALWLDP